MKDVFVFGMGFVSGWAARASVESAREAAVTLIAAGYRTAHHLRVRFETEREFVLDLVAEGRARFEAGRDGGQGESDEAASIPEDTAIRAA